MTETRLQQILRDSNYHLSIFNKAEIEALESNIMEKNGKPYVNCIIRGKDIQLKPEEVVRQLYTKRLIEEYGYLKKRITFEYPLFLVERKRGQTSLFSIKTSQIFHISSLK